MLNTKCSICWQNIAVNLTIIDCDTCRANSTQANAITNKLNQIKRSKPLC